MAAQIGHTGAQGDRTVKVKNPVLFLLAASHLELACVYLPSRNSHHVVLVSRAAATPNDTLKRYSFRDATFYQIAHMGRHCVYCSI